MADVSKADLRLVIFTDKTCGTCNWLKKSGMLEAFAKANPEVEILHMDNKKESERDEWADELELTGWPHVMITKKGDKTRLYGVKNVPTGVDQLNTLVEKALRKLRA